MILNITTTYKPATDIGYLLHKHPDKFQTVELSVGKAHLFYPEKNETRTTISLLLNIDSIDMIKKQKKIRHFGSGSFALEHYVNDRPYVASSFMSVAIAKAFSSAIKGKCKERLDLIGIKMPFEISLSVISVPKGGEEIIYKVFKPLGYDVELIKYQLDDKFPEWGDSRYYTLQLKNRITLQALLSHLYILIPALDNGKHHFIDENDIDILLEKGKGWLKEHPEREIIVKRYLSNIKSLIRETMKRLNKEEENISLNKEKENISLNRREKDSNLNREENNIILNEDEAVKSEIAKSNEKLISASNKERLHDKRIKFVMEKVLETGAKKVIDLGCGEGKLIRELIKEKQFTNITGMDVSYGELLRLKENLYYKDMSPTEQERINFFQGSLMYRDDRLKGFDVATVIEVIEHLELNKLDTFVRSLFEFAKPKTIIITTPNKEYNVVWEKLGDDLRHDDHRFEWTRKEFYEWGNRVAKKYNYKVNFFSIGETIKNLGGPSQMGIFSYGD